MSKDVPIWVQKHKHQGWRLSVWVQPGAKKTQSAGLHGDCLKIRLQAPAVDNKANKALTLFVAQALGLKAHEVTIDFGHTSRKKSLIIHLEEEPCWTLLSNG